MNKNGRPRSNTKWARQNLRKKILEKYGSFKDFCKEIGYTDIQLFYVMSGQRFGSVKFWLKVQHALSIPNQDLYLYQQFDTVQKFQEKS